MQLIHGWQIQFPSCDTQGDTWVELKRNKSIEACWCVFMFFVLWRTHPKKFTKIDYSYCSKDKKKGSFRYSSYCAVRWLTRGLGVHVSRTEHYHEEDSRWRRESFPVFHRWFRKLYTWQIMYRWLSKSHSRVDETIEHSPVQCCTQSICHRKVK